MYKLLELSVSTEQILKDMALYAALGFGEHQANEIVPHHYGILGDGDFHVGLHAADFDSPTLTCVLPDVAKFAAALGSLNTEFERACLSDDQFNQISLFDPEGQRINLIEARTFSPTLDDNARPHRLGRFIQIELPWTEEREIFWARLHAIMNPSDDDEEPAAPAPLVTLNRDRKRLTVVYECDLDALIVHSAQEGWQRFAITADDFGVFRTPHDFDLLFCPAPAQDQS